MAMYVHSYYKIMQLAILKTMIANECIYLLNRSTKVIIQLNINLTNNSLKCYKKINYHVRFILSNNYASPTSGEAYRNRRLTTNFEL